MELNLNFQRGGEGGENQKNPFMGEGWLGVDIFWKYTMEFPDKLRGTNHSTFHKRVTWLHKDTCIFRNKYCVWNTTERPRNKTLDGSNFIIGVTNSSWCPYNYFIEEIGRWRTPNRWVVLRFLWLALFNTLTAKVGLCSEYTGGGSSFRVLDFNNKLAEEHTFLHCSQNSDGISYKNHIHYGEGLSQRHLSPNNDSSLIMSTLGNKVAQQWNNRYTAHLEEEKSQKQISSIQAFPSVFSVQLFTHLNLEHPVPQLKPSEEYEAGFRQCAAGLICKYNRRLSCSTLKILCHFQS